MQKALFKRKKTIKFTGTNYMSAKVTNHLIDAILILGKTFSWLSLALFLGFIFLVFTINTSEAKVKPLITLKQAVNSTKAKFSGLIVVVKKDKDFKRTMVPKIIDEKGNSIYCNTDSLSTIQFNFLINSGIATFTDNINTAKQRSGNNPLIIEAMAAQNSDTAIISQENARKIIRENNKARFLNQFKVSFVVEN